MTTKKTATPTEKPTVRKAAQPAADAEAPTAAPVPAATDAKAAKPDEGQACRFQLSRDEVVLATVFGIDPYTGIADRVFPADEGRVFRGVRPGVVGTADGAGCYELVA